MMLTKGQKEKFSEGILNHFDMSRDMNESGLGLQFNGFYRKSDSFGSMADDAIKELGMTKSPEVFYIDPFFDGRAIALKPSGNVEDTRDFLRNVASFLALVAGLKILMKTIKSRSAGGYQESENIYGVSPVSRTPHVKMPAESTRSTIRNLEPQTSHDFSQTDLKNDPIARMKQRAAVQHVASAPIAPMPREGIVEKLSGLSGQSKLTAGVLVLGIILLFTQPSLLGAFIPLGITLWVYLRLAGAVSSSVGGLFSELGLSKSRARSDPFDRL